jgi:hypothetical protein
LKARRAQSAARKTLNIDWHITADDKACVKALLEKQRDTELVRDRLERNLAEPKPDVTKEGLWHEMVCMRLTTLARAGPESRIERFQCMRQRNYRLDRAVVGAICSRPPKLRA